LRQPKAGYPRKQQGNTLHYWRFWRKVSGPPSMRGGMRRRVAHLARRLRPFRHAAMEIVQIVPHLLQREAEGEETLRHLGGPARVKPSLRTAAIAAAYESSADSTPSRRGGRRRARSAAPLARRNSPMASQHR
jgi:hypothetical protein